jgi:hypothetical protein
MKPLAWAAMLPPPREERPRFPVNRPMVLRTLSTSAPRPDVRLLPPLDERVLLGLAMAPAYPKNSSQTGVC